MKILHTGDIHLDSAFSNENIQGSEKRREAQRELFGRIMALAREEACDMVLIAGDLFDSGYVSKETERFVTRVLSEMNCPVIIAPGNHDPFVDGSFYKRGDLPENVYVFNSSEMQMFEFEQLHTSIYGYAFTSASLRESPLGERAEQKSDGEIRILCAHGDLEVPVSRYAPILSADIERWGFTYAALGHVHNPSADHGGEGNRIRYCGFPEGRSYDELGDGHVLIVEIENGECHVSERKVSRVKYEKTDVDISGISDVTELKELLRGVTNRDGYGEGTCLRVYLNGSSELDLSDEIPSMEKECAGSLDELKLIDETVPFPDASALYADITIKGEFYRALLPELTCGDTERRRVALRALQIGLAVMDDKDPMKRRGGDR